MPTVHRTEHKGNGLTVWTGNTLVLKVRKQSRTTEAKHSPCGDVFDGGPSSS